jgi:hypothetical protein
VFRVKDGQHVSGLAFAGNDRWLVSSTWNVETTFSAWLEVRRVADGSVLSRQMVGGWGLVWALDNADRVVVFASDYSLEQKSGTWFELSASTGELVELGAAAGELNDLYRHSPAVDPQGRWVADAIGETIVFQAIEKGSLGPARESVRRDVPCLGSRGFRGRPAVHARRSRSEGAGLQVLVRWIPARGASQLGCGPVGDADLRTGEFVFLERDRSGDPRWLDGELDGYEFPDDDTLIGLAEDRVLCWNLVDGLATELWTGPLEDGAILRYGRAILARDAGWMLHWVELQSKEQVALGQIPRGNISCADDHPGRRVESLRSGVQDSD